MHSLVRSPKGRYQLHNQVFAQLIKRYEACERSTQAVAEVERLHQGLGSSEAITEKSY
jgi:hypothetical protein